jgi:hypothetical protein
MPSALIAICPIMRRVHRPDNPQKRATLRFSCDALVRQDSVIAKLLRFAVRVVEGLPALAERYW